VTVVRSASGTRIDCDACGEHTASSSWSADDLRSSTRFVLYDGRDWCPDCWDERSKERTDERPPA